MILILEELLLNPKFRMLILISFCIMFATIYFDVYKIHSSRKYLFQLYRGHSLPLKMEVGYCLLTPFQSLVTHEM